MSGYVSLHAADDPSTIAQLSTKAVWWQRGNKASVVSMLLGVTIIGLGLAIMGIFIAIVLSNPETTSRFDKIVTSDLGRKIITAGIGVLLGGSAIFMCGAAVKLLLGSQQPA